MHTHSLHATAVSLVTDVLPAVHYYIVRLGGPVPVVPYATYGSEELARATGDALQTRQAAILQNHGTVTIGRTLAGGLRPGDPARVAVRAVPQGGSRPRLRTC